MGELGGKVNSGRGRLHLGGLNGGNLLLAEGFAHDINARGSEA